MKTKYTKVQTSMTMQIFDIKIINYIVLFLVLYLACVSNSFANENIVNKKVTATGETKEAAIINCLIEALRQAEGLTVEAKKSLHSVFMESLESANGQTNERSTSTNIIGQDISSKTGGYIKSYDIINEVHNQNSLGWEVTLIVAIASYKTPGISPNSRRKIAIIPFRTKQASYSFRGRHIPSSEISRQFTQKLVTEMTQTRRFTVLDREYMEEFLREKSLVLSADAPVSEQMKIGEVLGVDYLLVGTITEGSQKQIPYTIQITGETGYDYSASFVADYRIMVMATRQIKWSDSVTISLGDAKIKSMVPSLRPEKIQQSLLGKAAQQIVHRAIENIYPIRVVKVQQNGELILNQGGVTVSDGEMLDVFIKGERIVDPYTGESLGSSETWAATIKIVRVIPKMSYARVIKGQLATIQNSSICRRIAEKNKQSHQSATGRKTDVQTTSGGGVVLPFD